MFYQIRVTDPATGKFVEWKSANLRSLKNQAKIEVDKGADVFIANESGVVIWTPEKKGRNR